jgi:hypothetical protein
MGGGGKVAGGRGGGVEGGQTQLQGRSWELGCTGEATSSVDALGELTFCALVSLSTGNDPFTPSFLINCSECRAALPPSCPLHLPL